MAGQAINALGWIQLWAILEDSSEVVVGLQCPGLFSYPTLKSLPVTLSLLGAPGHRVLMSGFFLPHPRLMPRVSCLTL